MGLVPLTMLVLSFAAYPFYKRFCSATGFAGTTQRASAAPKTRGGRVFVVRFDANVAPGLPWRFEPETPQISVRAGDTTTVFFRATNLSDHATEGVARFNVQPDQAGSWFDKLQCFCFNAERLGPHETAEWAVVFFLDPKLKQDDTMDTVDAITLSYTFFAPPNATKAEPTKTGAADAPATPGKS
ncbi:cytochrome c oxidase assembly protein [Rhodoblastus acidophilus]|uniref:Cytochrome c oxidase assembly protein CtaG n=1 Tax=Candidatus Rhodoblastus alkanivorans TaxID=2954117 RepID=A0ABS9ZCD7_9HYPH|nr:cytochrome c oxidase assembly protein [Candidatus Rhodoblastus alkanivorans]MCI4684616.1 cytochrome c oxidase assembly protein [Candidatus Rhodoblastus alkanivorans]MDI4641938.1 cytochrome c oxidase assembly protein [Rhodoblastus acidophilus]